MTLSSASAQTLDPSDPGETLFHSENAGHTYGKGHTALVAVRGVTCTVSRGDRIALTGPSGSGKSTLLHMIAGLERPTTGQVSWGERSEAPSGEPGTIGVIFQGLSLIPSLNAVENVALPLVIGGVSDLEAHTRAYEALELLGLQDLAARLPDELSGGQAQRVAMSRVLVCGPRLILADEPTGQLDHAAGLHLMDVLLEVADRLNAALLVSTHDPMIAERLPTLWRMDDGALLTEITATSVDPEKSRR
jgi:putative ABC transport system ATP-binding protein